MSVIINLQNGRDPVHIVKIIQGETFTVPRTSTVISPTSEYLAKSLDSKRDTVGGQFLAIVDDSAGGELAQTAFPQQNVRPGDVIAVGAVDTGKSMVTINGTTAFEITTTAFAAVLLMYM